MARADVSSLYTIISHGDGFEAVDTFLRRDMSLLAIQRDLILKLLTFAMNHNFGLAAP